jgi:hypothetical protein
VKLTRPASPVAQQIAIAAGLIWLFWLALPLPAPRTVTGSSTVECLTQADRSPEPGALSVLERCAALLPADAELSADLGAAYAAAGLWDAA